MVDLVMRRVALTLLAALLAFPGVAQAADRDIRIGEKFSLRSRILDEDRPYWVYLPSSYDESGQALQRYPVLYLLDGDAHFHSASGVVQFMSGGINGNTQIPELIVVAIPNTNRMRDLTPTHTLIGIDGKEQAILETSGGGDAFLKFLSDELLPQIDSTYRTLPYRIVVGHSIGGLFVLHALLEAPGLFQAYVAIDPSVWWDDQELVRRAASRLRNPGRPRAAVYISLANTPDVGLGDPLVMRRAEQRLADTLGSAASPSLRATSQYFEAEDHASVPLLSLYYGLLYIFEGYKPLFSRELLQEPRILVNDFECISQRLGIVLAPPEVLVNVLGYVMLYQGRDPGRAVEFFKLNVWNFPGSYNVYDSLGEAYMVMDEKALAIDNYERSLELNPANENAKERLQKLRGQGPAQ